MPYPSEAENQETREAVIILVLVGTIFFAAIVMVALTVGLIFEGLSK